MPDAKVSPWRLGAAWGVHVLTGCGALAGLMALIAVAQHEWKSAFVWMGVTILIDSIDGTLARRCSVKRVLPEFDGALLDNIVDYFTYVIVPAYFVYEGGIVPHAWALATASIITLASAYQFCQADAKTDDHCFKGFPSYWNLTVFYLFLLAWPRGVNAAVLIALAVAVFVPIKYLYPSRTLPGRRWTLALTSVWGVLLLLILARWPGDVTILVYGSLAYVVYYFAFSVYLTYRGRTHRP